MCICNFYAHVWCIYACIHTYNYVYYIMVWMLSANFVPGVITPFWHIVDSKIQPTWIHLIIVHVMLHYNIILYCLATYNTWTLKYTKEAKILPVSAPCTMHMIKSKSTKNLPLQIFAPYGMCSFVKCILVWNKD